MIYQLPNALSFHFLFFRDLLVTRDELRQLHPSPPPVLLPALAPHPVQRLPPAAVSHHLQTPIKVPSANTQTLISAAAATALFTIKMKLL